MPKLKKSVEPSKVLLKTLDGIASRSKTNKTSEEVAAESRQKFEEKLKSENVVVFRLFECVVHLEIALAELKKVGMFLGDNSETLIRQHNSATVSVESLYKEYLKQWGEMPK